MQDIKSHAYTIFDLNKFSASDLNENNKQQNLINNIRKKMQ